MHVAKSAPTGEQRAKPDPTVLLAWYDRHRRKLPWRALPGAAADAYRVWLSEIMLQQTTVKAVAPYYQKFLARWPSVEALAAAPLEDVLKVWAGLGYYARAHHLHACAKAVVERHAGRFPPSEATLRTLPGIGSYTAAAVAAIAFDQPATPVDGNIERVIARLFAIEDQTPTAKPTIRQVAQTLTPAKRAGDYAQAIMDLGATICTPKKPTCALCPWNEPCIAHRRGDQETFPRKAPKVEGRLRRGAAFWVVRADVHVLVRTRPSKGLLGGMTEVPTTEWTHDFDDTRALEKAPLRANWHRLSGLVRHTFTHFPLELTVYATEVRESARAPADARWLALADIPGEAFPSVMRKVIAHARAG